MASFHCPPYEIIDTIPGIVWPAIPGSQASNLLSLHAQLEQSQWFSPEELLELQFRQLRPLLYHAWQAIPFYRKRLNEAGYSPGEVITDINAWGRLPILTREQLQTLGDEIRSKILPEGHGSGYPLRTSGSTGMPITVYRNNIDRQFWHAITLREHLWHRRDVRARMAIIRKLDSPEIAPPPHGKHLDSWGPPFDHIYVSGSAGLLDLGVTPVRIQAEWLRQVDPDYLLTYPSNAAALALYFSEKGYELKRLREILTLSETLSSDTRDACSNAWNAPIKDMYSAQEVGYIALQCPEEEHYHVQSESLMVEVVDEAGRLCLPGEVGRVVVTALHSFVTPLLRYDIGDYAEVGEPCPCGRGLPVLKRIMGRSRNMLTYPSGDQVWPVVRPSYYSQIAPVRQVQMVQHEKDRIEVRLVVSAPVSAEQEMALRKAIHESLMYPFYLEFKYLDQIERTAGGKFEEFISCLT